MGRAPLLLFLFVFCIPARAQPVGEIGVEIGAAMEHLAIPDIPVRDRSGRSEGFATRLSRAGPVLIAFSYTSCLSLCPVSHAILGLVDDALAEPGAPALRIITLSLDPARDTPEALDAAARALRASPRWDWLVASPAATPALLASLGVPPGPPEAHEPVFLIGDIASGTFRRLGGLPDPALLIALAREAS